MADQPMIDGTTVPDMLNQPVSVGDTIAAAFSEMGGPSLRVGVVLGFVQRATTDRTDPHLTFMQVQWTAAPHSLLALSRPTRIEAGLRRFMRIDPVTVTS